MDANKKWYQSKAIWAGAAGVIIAIYNALVISLGANCGVEGALCITLPAIPEFIFGILAALGVYGRGSATAKITK